MIISIANQKGGVAKSTTPIDVSQEMKQIKEQQANYSAAAIRTHAR